MQATCLNQALLQGFPPAGLVETLQEHTLGLWDERLQLMGSYRRFGARAAPCPAATGVFQGLIQPHQDSKPAKPTEGCLDAAPKLFRPFVGFFPSSRASRLQTTEGFVLNFPEHFYFPRYTLLEGYLLQECFVYQFHVGKSIFQFLIN